MADGHIERMRNWQGAVQTVFIDESQSETRPSMAGFVSSMEKWEKFSVAWKTDLDAPPAISFFHMSEVLRQHGGVFANVHMDQRLRCGLARPARKQYSSNVGLGDSRRSENDSTPRSARQPPCQRRKLVRAMDRRKPSSLALPGTGERPYEKRSTEAQTRMDEETE